MEDIEQGPEISEKEIKENINSLKAKLQPYQKPILYIGISIFLLLLLFFGFGMGAYKICDQVDGFLDDKFYCHTDYYKDREQQDPYVPEALQWHFNLS